MRKNIVLILVEALKALQYLVDLKNKYNVIIPSGMQALTGPVYKQRVEGFCTEIAKFYPGIEILNVNENYEYFNNENIAYNIAKKVISEVPGLSAIYVASVAGAIGVGRALKELNAADRIKVVGYDLTDEIRDMINTGILQATICQHPYAQGYYPIKILFRYLTHDTTPVKNKIKGENLYTRLGVLFRGNISDLDEDNQLYSIF